MNTIEGCSTSPIRPADSTPPWERNRERVPIVRQKFKHEKPSRDPNPSKSNPLPEKVSLMLAAIEAVDEVTAEARERGIAVELSAPNKHGNFRHWMFNDAVDGKRLMDYWPSTGRCFCHRHNRSFNVSGAMDALDAVRA